MNPSEIIQFDVLEMHKYLHNRWIPWPPQGQSATDYDRTTGFLSWVIRTKLAGYRRVYSIEGKCLFPIWEETPGLSRDPGLNLSSKVNAYLIGNDSYALEAAETGILIFPTRLLFPKDIEKLLSL